MILFQEKKDIPRSVCENLNLERLLGFIGTI